MVGYAVPVISDKDWRGFVNGKVHFVKDQKVILELIIKTNCNFFKVLRMIFLRFQEQLGTTRQHHLIYTGMAFH